MGREQRDDLDRKVYEYGLTCTIYPKVLAALLNVPRNEVKSSLRRLRAERKVDLVDRARRGYWGSTEAGYRSNNI